MTQRASKDSAAQPTQIDKFKEAAREAETDDSEERFDAALKRVAKAPANAQPTKKP